jgi:ADP-heptose:LPS heptosyltransferase
VVFHSLQVPVPEGDEACFHEYSNLVDAGARCRDFLDTAMAIRQLDLVISVDTAVAHLAGAMAKPVWTFVPYSADWRWFLDRTDTPWYPTMRLFRQSHRGQWQPVIAQAAAELHRRVELQPSPGE